MTSSPANRARRRVVAASVLTLLLLVVSLTAQSSPAQFGPSLMIKAERTFSVNEIVVTETLYLKGAQQRRDATVRDPQPRSLLSTIADCSDRRTLVLNHDTKLFAYRAYEERRGDGVTRAQTDVPPDVSTLFDTTIESTDTGERRRVGSYIARRVKTTSTTEAVVGFVRHNSVGHEDGWYIDLPKSYCGGTGTGVRVLPDPAGDPADDVAPGIRVERRGAALLGFPIERIQGSSSDLSGVTTVKLLQFSEAPLHDDLFTIPSGYQPALPDPYSVGRFDMSRPDTLANRLKTYWRLGVDWTNYLFDWANYLVR